MDEQVAQETPKLGFGLMRLPGRGLGMDVAQVSRMVDLFLEAGFTYFDTADVYAGSEDAIRKALVERRPRESNTLATKLYAAMSPSAKSAKRQFETSLERIGAGYFDHYLLHSASYEADAVAYGATALRGFIGSWAPDLVSAVRVEGDGLHVVWRRRAE